MGSAQNPDLEWPDPTRPLLGESTRVEAAHPHSRFENLTYADFRKLATDPSLSPHEKIGFPNEYRQDKERLILDDIVRKVSALGGRRKTVLDIGPGCGALARMLIDLCEQQEHTLLLVDCPEMLAHLPDRPFMRKYPGRFPQCDVVVREYSSRIDAVLAYSVAHYVFVESSIFDFVDQAVALLAPGGELLIGDIPNVSKRKRFFSSAAGVAFHQNFVGRPEQPAVGFNHLEPAKMDDAVVVSLLLRARLAGADSYVLPQGGGLPMANRREDILIRKP
jgi:hypothetical protein